MLILCHQTNEFALNQLFFAPEVTADVILKIFPSQMGKVVGKTQMKFSRMSEKCVKVRKIVEKIRQIWLYLSRAKGRFDRIKSHISPISWGWQCCILCVLKAYPGWTAPWAFSSTGVSRSHNLPQFSWERGWGIHFRWLGQRNHQLMAAGQRRCCS